jgi:hypothetical protein
VEGSIPGSREPEDPLTEDVSHDLRSSAGDRARRGAQETQDWVVAALVVVIGRRLPEAAKHALGVQHVHVGGRYSLAKQCIS